jgi:predicted kinase
VITVIVNGLPGSGKTTLAPRLARALDLPLFAKDAVKETLADVIGVTPPDGRTPLEWSRTLGAATNEAIWTLLGLSGRGAVLESPFLARLRDLAAVGLKRAGVALDDVHEVWCDVPLEVAMARYATRAARRHPIHFDDLDKSDRWADWATSAEPLGFGTVHRIDTTTPIPDQAIAALATQITPHLPVDPGIS